MESSSLSKQGIAEKRGVTPLWAAVLGAPVIWLIHLQAIYITSDFACSMGTRTPIHVMSVVALLLIAGGGVLSYRTWKKYRADKPDPNVGGEVGRTRFLATLGMLSSGLFGIVTIAQAIAAFMINPCVR